jgi:hypothetical protein
LIAIALGVVNAGAIYLSLDALYLDELLARMAATAGAGRVVVSDPTLVTSPGRAPARRRDACTASMFRDRSR